MSRRLKVYLFLILLGAFLGMVPSVRADLPPPIYYAWMDSGGLFTLASNVSLPEAAVDVSIKLTGSWSYDISVSCSFTVASQVSQNLTTAFVYPEIWIVADPSQRVTVLSFNIWTNDTPTEYAILTFDEFKSQYNLNQTNWEYIDDCSFALFNFSINAEQTTEVRVNTRFITSSTGHDFYFDYIIDTARRWEGNTHEIVKIGFQKANDTEIIKYSYSPENNSEFTGDEYSANITWDFTIHEFPYDRVRFQVQQKEYPKYHSALDSWIRAIFNITTSIVIVLFICYLIRRRARAH